MAEQTDAEILEFFRARGFGLTIGYGERPAVIVVDFMNAFSEPDMPLGANLDAEIAATVELLTAARAAKLPILHTVVYYDEEDMADAGVWLLKQKGLLSLKAGTTSVELDPRLDRRPNEAIVLKKYASCFFGSDLVSRLNAAHVDTLLITGCTTSGCVRATAVDAVQYGYRPMVVREAVGDRSAPAHKQALFDLEQKYCDVVALEDSIAYVDKIGAQTAAQPAG
jgi:nicotinamidase-related amidase